MIESPRDFAARIYGMMASANGGSGSGASSSGGSSSAAQAVDPEVL